LFFLQHFFLLIVAVFSAAEDYFAANFFNVDPETISPLISRVDNGWISSIGYQAKGYQLVPVY
jgi:hypothetical protein